VELLGPLLEKLRPWLPATVNFALYNGEELACQKCGSDDLESRGTAYTATRAYPQFRCRACGGWTRDSRSEMGTRAAGVAR
jgi:DNA-directed RNA polymerase subunit RPC12/RpoP